MARIHFATQDNDWKKKIVDTLNKMGLVYSTTDEWRDCEIIVVDLNFTLGKILRMMAKRRVVRIEDYAPVICMNPGEDDISYRIECIRDALEFKPPILKDDDELITFIRWFDHFLPRTATTTKDADKALGYMLKSFMGKLGDQDE